MSSSNLTSIKPVDLNVNQPAPGIPYFTPAQNPAAGTALEHQKSGKPIPKLFKPLTLRGVTFQNRIMLSPLCQYSADDGHLTAWHMAHLGGIIQRGPGLTMVEATAVQPEGRITPEDSGLWKDSQIEPLRQIVEYAHSQNQLLAIQLAHAGRKASTVAPWLSMGATATAELNGWPDNVYGPSAIPFSDTFPPVKEMTKADITAFKQAYVAAVNRALKAGVDVIEIHAAHGYLLHEFLSPVSNKRTDDYGGSFDNRIRLLVEIIDLTRQTIPSTMPLFVRISATDWLEESDIKESWTLDQAVKLGQIVAERGVDLLDVSSGGNHPKQHIHAGPAYQAKFAKAIKEAVGDKMAVGTVGMLENATLANSVLEEQDIDLAIVGRGFQKNPGLVWTWAEELGVEIQLANQIRWGFAGRGKKQT